MTIKDRLEKNSFDKINTKDWLKFIEGEISYAVIEYKMLKLSDASKLIMKALKVQRVICKEIFLQCVQEKLTIEETADLILKAPLPEL